jgi:hypothetical protein
MIQVQALTKRYGSRHLDQTVLIGRRSVNHREDEIIVVVDLRPAGRSALSPQPRADGT